MSKTNSILVCLTVLNFCFVLNLRAQLSSDSLAIYFNQNEYTKVVNHANSNIKDYSQLSDTLNISFYFKSIYKIANDKLRQGLYSKAEICYEECIRNFKSLYRNEKIEDYSDYINNLAVCYLNQKKYLEAEPLFIEAIEIRKLSSEKTPLNFAISINNLAELYSAQGKYLKAEPLFKEALLLNKNISGKNSERYNSVRNRLASIYSKNDKYSEAETLYLECIEYAREVYGEEHLDYGIALDNLGLLYLEQDRFLDAEPLFNEALEIFKVTPGKESSDFAICLNNLASLYFKKGDYIKSEQFFLQTLNIKKNLYGETSTGYAITLRGLSDLYKEKNEAYKQEKTLLKALDIFKETLGENHPRYSRVLYDLANFYTNYGIYEKANKLYTQACEISKISFGSDNLNYLNCLSKHARLFLLQGDYKSAERLFLEALSISKKTLSDNHNSRTTTLHNLAVLYQHQQKFEESEELFLQLVEIYGDDDDKESLSYAATLGSFSVTLFQLNKTEEAEAMLLKSVEMIGRIQGFNSAYYNTGLLNLAYEYIIQDNFEKANRYALKTFEYYRKEIRDASTFLNSREIINLKEKLESNRLTPLLILENFETENKEIAIEVYQNELLIKNLTLRNFNKVRESIEQSDDRDLKEKYHKYLTAKHYLFKVENLPIKERPKDYELLLNSTEKLEKEILNLSQSYSESYKYLSLQWDEIKSHLKDGEVLIDFLSYNDGSDNILSAFVLKKEFDAPKYVYLLEQNNLNSIFKKVDSIFTKETEYNLEKAVGVKYVNSAFKDYLLKDISMHLEGVKTIYVSPSGMMHKINFSALPLSNEQIIGEKYDVHVLGSSADVINYSNTFLNKNKDLDFLLYGDIDYDNQLIDSSSIRDSVFVKNSKQFNELATRSGINSWGYLPGTAQEVEVIKTLIKANGFKSLIINGSSATKSSILAFNGKTSPYVLHLATHGFFFEDPTKEIQKVDSMNFLKIDGAPTQSSFYKVSEDPMLRSGLVFSGVNNYWGKPIKSSVDDDGILTAKEISNLDLRACQLVVLSACETGLGDINGSEGVFGLQRAFNMAGVKNIIMSLWKVPDAQTAELFDLFYGFCFEGKSIHEALRMAQAEMKLKYSPFYWAGFVLLE